jgi:hypothetical protein
MYVADAYASIRAIPDQRSKPIANAPIRAQLVATCELRSWVRVYSESDERFAGWVLLESLYPFPPSIEFLLAMEESAAKSMELQPQARLRSRLLLSRRAVALEPNDTRAHDMLVRVLRDMGDSKALREAMEARTKLTRSDNEIDNE